MTEIRRESSNPTKISPPPPRRPGQCPHFREARLLTANSTSRSWQRWMRHTGDAQNVTVTCTELAACPESRRTLRLRDRGGWHYGHDRISQAPDLLLTQEKSPLDCRGLDSHRKGYGTNVLRLTFAIFLVFTYEIGVLNSWLHVPVALDNEALYTPRDLDLYWRDKCRAH